MKLCNYCKKPNKREGGLCDYCFTLMKEERKKINEMLESEKDE